MMCGSFDDQIFKLNTDAICKENKIPDVLLCIPTRYYFKRIIVFPTQLIQLPLYALFCFLKNVKSKRKENRRISFCKLITCLPVSLKTNQCDEKLACVVLFLNKQNQNFMFSLFLHSSCF